MEECDSGEETCVLRTGIAFVRAESPAATRPTPKNTVPEHSETADTRARAVEMAAGEVPTHGISVEEPRDSLPTRSETQDQSHHTSQAES